MTMLAETDTNPIRKFISYRDQVAYDTLDNLLLKVGERDLKIQGDLTPEEREKYGLDSNQAGDDADALRGRKIAAALKHKRLQGIDSQVKTYDFNNGETTIGVTLDEAKMAAASGKRAAELGQAAVMGGFSASNIASGLGWEKQRLASGFFSSEWLHLSAFSWGGFMPTGAKSGFSTSQNLENLIFGTSETNSLMTRYEMAWQDFYRKEQKIHEKIAKARNEDPKSLQGRLRIHCNNFSEPIRCDVNAGDKYRFTDFTIDQALVNKTALLAEENFQSQNPTTMRALYATRSDNSRTVNQDSRTPFTTEKEMLYLAHDFPAVVYSVEYAIENEFDSVLLDSKACASFSFYPFHRSLYHQAEAVLDALVWKKVKVMADFLVNRELEEEETDEEKALVSQIVPQQSHNDMVTLQADSNKDLHRLSGERKP
ncbi:hypothetical protein B0H66DRAFT_482762 [Apodospora peruviana]|uniref:Uncharacterized protein n=1 Tax=Apodospora peruviana TaxID=516989 RepID=A0AAE0HWK7_9PEZI|nr:hypothetical protein B0H66DRAFT_482762 [Apodospora peruviana]